MKQDERRKEAPFDFVGSCLICSLQLIRVAIPSTCDDTVKRETEYVKMSYKGKSVADDCKKIPLYKIE